jgi:hypothetical protein
MGIDFVSFYDFVIGFLNCSGLLEPPPLFKLCCLTALHSIPVNVDVNVKGKGFFLTLHLQIVERDKIDTHNTQIHDSSWLGTDTSIKVVGLN